MERQNVMTTEEFSEVIMNLETRMRHTRYKINDNENQKDDLITKIASNYEIVGRLFLAGQQNDREMELWRQEVERLENKLSEVYTQCDLNNLIYENLREQVQTLRNNTRIVDPEIINNNNNENNEIGEANIQENNDDDDSSSFSTFHGSIDIDNENDENDENEEIGEDNATNEE